MVGWADGLFAITAGTLTLGATPTMREAYVLPIVKQLDNAPKEAFRGAAAGGKTEPELLVSEWADKRRVLVQKSSAEPGPWRTSRTPYLREPMDALSTQSQVNEVILMFASQLGKSEVILNLIGYVVDHAPGPAMLVQPTVDMGKRFSNQRVSPLFETAVLQGKLDKAEAGKVPESKSRDAKSSMFSKDFKGGILIITGANSAVGLRSMPVRYLFLDEVDAYPIDIDGEGSPIDLAEARQRTFARYRRLKTSTPTIHGASAIENAYEGSDKRRYFVPCPYCGVLQTLEFPRLVWTKLNRAPKYAAYECAHCFKIIEERHKTEMLARGEWRATTDNPEPDPRIRGYHLNALYAPLGWTSWGDLAEKFVKVRKEPAKFKGFVNTELAETWKEKGDAPEWKRLYQRRESYEIGKVPEGGLILTSGVDVQKDRLVVEVVAWGRDKQSWSVLYGMIPGDSSDLGPKGPWPQVDALLARSYIHARTGVELQILRLAVDSGYNTQTVYTWAKGHPGNVISIKGREGTSGALVGAPSPVEITLRGRPPVKGYKVWPVTGGIAKTELYGYLGLEKEPSDPYPAGWCHFPEYDEDYFKQLTGEHLVTHKNHRGYFVTEWKLIPGRENHTLDARVYARAAANVIGLDRFGDRDWENLERQAGVRA